MAPLLSAWDKLTRALTPQSGAAGDGDHQLASALSTLLSGEDQTANRLLVEPRNSFANITTTTTTVVKNGAGFLHVITFNKPIATCVVTIYDNTAASGTIIGTITIPASPMVVSFLYDVSFVNGLTILTATAASDITVSYR